jgi:PAS domain S-box-containing protein
MTRESLPSERPPDVVLEAETLLADFLKDSPVPIFVKGKEGSYLYVNEAWVISIGLSREEVLGRLDDDLFPAPVARHFREGDMLAMSSNQSIQRQETVWLPDGEEHSFRVVKFPLRSSGGEVAGVCGIAIEISDSVRAERQRVEERERIAMKIHDDAIQVLATVALRLDTFERVVEDENQRAKLSLLRDTVTTATDRLREVMADLNSRLPEKDVVVALKDLLAELRNEHGLRFTFSSGLDRDPDPECRAALFRIGREALMNVVRHASASHVQVQLTRSEGGVQLSVTDDGVGFEGDRSPEGHLGLTSMRSRAEQVGGRFVLESGSGKGTRIEVWLPEPLQHSVE